MIATRSIGLFLVAMSCVTRSTAQPSITLTDNFEGLASLSVFLDEVGETEIEFVVSFDNTTLISEPSMLSTGSLIPIVGDNPFVQGSEGTVGLAYDEIEGVWIFGAFAVDLPVGIHEIVSFEYDADRLRRRDPCDSYVGFGGFMASAVVTQDGGQEEELTASSGVFIDLFSDINGDAIVNLVDLSILGVNFGGPGGFSQGDLNGDGFVGLVDLSILGQDFSPIICHGRAIPEPTALSFLLVATLLRAISGPRRNKPIPE